ncbi:IS110 family RNA-guided transposase [Spirosoma fluminis]
MTTYIGIDVSKDSLSVAIPKPTTGWTVCSYANTPDGIRSLLNQLPNQAHCVLEATGSYSVLVTYMLTQAKVAISVINPKQSHHFAKMHLSVTKTDPQDAVLLSEYGRMTQPAIYQISSDSLLLLRQKRTLLRQYQKQRVVLLNLLESFQPLPLKDPTVQHSLQEMIAHFQAAIAQLKTEINQVCQADFADQYKRLRSIKGISDAVATALIETTNGFRDFTSAKALAKFIGVAPIIYQSGKVGITKGINRSGDAHLRGQLYMASLSAIRYNKACRECYQRLKAAGKVTNVALMAVVNKLLRQAYAVVKFNEDYDPNYQPVIRSLT